MRWFKDWLRFAKVMLSRANRWISVCGVNIVRLLMLFLVHADLQLPQMPLTLLPN